MTLPEIFVQLPPSVASHFEELLEIAPIHENPTREEALEVLQNIRTELSYSVGFNDEDVLALIDQIPEAVVEQLFA